MWFEHIFNLSATLLAIYLLYNEFSNFIIVRPTQTSLEQSPQKTEYFPLFMEGVLRQLLTMMELLRMNDMIIHTNLGMGIFLTLYTGIV